jgi:predicted transcriptional regulator
MTAIGLEKSMGVGEATARRFVASLTESGLIEHQGSKKTGGYHTTTSESELKLAMPKCNTCILFKTIKTKNHEEFDK